MSETKTRRYSNSYLNQLAFCPLSCHYKYDLKLHPIEGGGTHHAAFGKAGHEAMRVLYTDNDVEAAKATFLQHYPNQLDPNDHAKTAENACRALDGYVRQYNYDRQWEVLACEDLTAAEDGYVVKLDLVVRDVNTDSIYGVDHKFRGGKLDYSFFNKFNPNSQVTQYYKYIKERWGHCDGFIINAIGLTWLNEKKVDGKWNGKYFDVADPDRLAYSHRETRYVKYYKKEMVACWGLKVEFERHTLTRTGQQIAQDDESKLYWIQRAEEARASGVYGMNTKQCFLCEYQPACGAGWDWEHDSELILNHYQQLCDKFIPDIGMHCNLSLGHEDGCKFNLTEAVEPTEFEVTV